LEGTAAGEGPSWREADGSTFVEAAITVPRAGERCDYEGLAGGSSLVGRVMMSTSPPETDEIVVLWEKDPARPVGTRQVDHHGKNDGSS